MLVPGAKGISTQTPLYMVDCNLFPFCLTVRENRRINTFLQFFQYWWWLNHWWPITSELLVGHTVLIMFHWWIFRMLWQNNFEWLNFKTIESIWTNAKPPTIVIFVQLIMSSTAFQTCSLGKVLLPDVLGWQSNYILVFLRTWGYWWINVSHHGNIEGFRPQSRFVSFNG